MIDSAMKLAIEPDVAHLAGGVDVVLAYQIFDNPIKNLIIRCSPPRRWTTSVASKTDIQANKTIMFSDNISQALAIRCCTRNSGRAS